MTEDELNDAVTAQIRWLQSQSITVENSVLVCAKTICVAIMEIAKAGDGDPPKGARAVARMIEDTVKGAEIAARTRAQPRRRPF